MVLSLIKTCPAKINLFLEVKNKRKDGYHNIESLMTFCNYGDSLSVKKSKKFVFRVNGPFSKELFGKYNLIEEAKNKLEFLYKREFKVDVLLTKNLPIASGMAGGSSNATTFIRCIREIFNLKDVSGFDNLLLSLGADIPFCYYGKTALVSGIGEKLKFVSIKEQFYFLLINPKIEISTQKIFASLKESRKKKEKSNKSEELVSLKFFSKRKNHLEGYAMCQSKKIEEILNFLNSLNGTLFSRMTGSGATCFALFDNLVDLESAETYAKKRFDNYWIKSSKLINSIKHI